MKKITSRASLVAGLIAASTVQAIELNDNLSLLIDVEAVSDYRSRGQSQSLGDPALQAGATLFHSSGFYAMVWTSTLDFGNGLKTRQELDYLGGYLWQINDDISLDVGHAKYTYPRSSQLNYNETYAVLSAYGFKAATQYADNYEGDQSYMWNWVGYETKLPYDIDVSLHYGVVDYKDDVLVSNSGKTRQRYDEWVAKVSKDFIGATWSLSYVDTDISKAECSNLMGYDDLCSATLVAGVKKSF